MDNTHDNQPPPRQPYSPQPPCQGHPQPVQQPYDVPEEIKKWNWGAFMFSAFWGIGNHATLTLLCFIPVFQWVWWFVCGAKGNEWAWKSGKFKDAETFMAIQESWNKAGKAAFVAALATLIAAGILCGVLLAVVVAALRPYSY
ncbi:MAG: ribonuclease G [Oscillospiraceae bacterium]